MNMIVNILRMQTEITQLVELGKSCRGGAAAQLVQRERTIQSLYKIIFVRSAILIFIDPLPVLIAVCRGVLDVLQFLML